MNEYCVDAGPTCTAIINNPSLKYSWENDLVNQSPLYHYINNLPDDNITAAALNLYLFRGQDFYLFTWQKRAEPGGYYWWNANIQFFANGNYQQEVLRYAQTAYFVNVVTTRLITILLSKTRKESFLDHGVGNMILNYAMFSEVGVLICLVYVPAFNIVFQTRQLYALHWFVGTGFAVFIFWYEETRKMISRRMGNESWFDRILCW